MAVPALFLFRQLEVLDPAPAVRADVEAGVLDGGRDGNRAPRHLGMEPLDDAVALRPADPGGLVGDALQLQEQLVGMLVRPPAELAAIVGADRLRQATLHDPRACSLLRTIPGIGKIHSLVMLYEIDRAERFARSQPANAVLPSGTPSRASVACATAKVTTLTEP